MTGPLLSPSWYRVAALTPRLRSHTELHRHEYRGETWYVLEDRSTERFHRFSPAGYLVIGLMDGRRTLQEVWDVAVARLGDDAPTQDEMIHLLSQLHAADVLQCDVPPDTEDLLRRYERQRRSRWLSNVLSPLSWRFPLVDPQRFLVAVRPLVQAVMGWPGVILWLVIVTPAVPLLASHWTDLTRDVVDRALVPQNLVYVWLAFPLIKACHELGHAFAVAAYGGEVHEMGVMLLVLSPVPYVDASAASAFREKWRRVLVGAAGMLVELALAALALFVWLAAQPGLVRTLAYNTILIAGVTTILFNANPLLRYDGYYILTDLLEIPNLRARASAYLSYLCERYAFGRRETERPAATAGERAWFVAFGVAASAYRVLVVVAIFLFLADKLFVLGKLLALVAVTWAVVPVVKAFRFVLTERRLRPVRVRAVGLTVGGAVALAAFLAFVPVPHRGLVEGVVWIPDEAVVRAAADGFVERVVARSGGRVAPGDLLVVCRAPAVEARVAELTARVAELEARITALRPTDRVKTQIAEAELGYAEQDLAQARQRVADLAIRSRTAGTFVVPDGEDLPGRYLHQGDSVGYVVDLSTTTVRAVVPQSDIDLVRGETRAVAVRLAERLARAYPARITRLVPGATAELPSSALGTVGGGAIPTDPTDTRGTKTLEKLFVVDVTLPSATHVVDVGSRAHIRFDFGRQPLGMQWYRAVRQLFLSRFDV